MGGTMAGRRSRLQKRELPKPAISNESKVPAISSETAKTPKKSNKK